jgi:hypothetical protein
MLSHRYDDFDVCDAIVRPSLSIDAIEKGTGPRPASREVEAGSVIKYDGTHRHRSVMHLLRGYQHCQTVSFYLHLLFVSFQ